MIHVAAPEGWQPPPDAVLAKPTAMVHRARPVEIAGLPETASQSIPDFDDIDSLLSGAKPTERAGRFRGVPQPSPAAKPFQTETPDAASAATRPPANWTDQAARNRKMILQIGALATLCVVALGLIVGLISVLFRGDAGSETAAEPPTPIKEVGPQPTPPAAKAATDSPGSDKLPVGELPAVAEPIRAAPWLLVPEMSLAASGVDTVAPGIELGADAPQTDIAPNLIDQFGDLADVLNQGESLLSLQEIEEAARPERGQIGIGSLLVRKPTARTVDLAARLRDPIPEISFVDECLIDAMRIISDVSTIPISYEWDLIDVEGISLIEPITLRASNTTVQGVLDQLLSPRKLQAAAQDGLLVVTVADRDEWSTQEYDLSGLGGDQPDISQNFAEFLQNTLARGSWQAAGGQATVSVVGPTLAVHQSAPVHALIGQLLGKLQAAKHLIAESRHEASRNALLSRRERSQVARQAAVSSSLVGDQRLERVLSMVARDIGTYTLVDWQALAQEGWNPQTEIPWATRGEPFEQRLRELADSMRLAVRIGGERTMVLTSPSAMQRHLELEVYPCADLLAKLTTEQLLATLDSVLGASVDSREGMSVTLESSSQCLVAVVPQPIQFRLESALAQIRRQTVAAK
jgi:hypothetical protein